MNLQHVDTQLNPWVRPEDHAALVLAGFTRTDTGYEVVQRNGETLRIDLPDPVPPALVPHLVLPVPVTCTPLGTNREFASLVELAAYGTKEGLW